MTVHDAWKFFAEEPPLRHAPTVLRDVGLGYLRLRLPATELSGGEAQPIQLSKVKESQKGTCFKRFT